MGNMSHDRVRFVIPARRLVSAKFATVIKATLGIELPVGASDEAIVIVCRPSQFGRFIVQRNKAGLQNSVKELKPDLFIPEAPRSRVFDASKNRNSLEVRSMTMDEAYDNA